MLASTLDAQEIGRPRGRATVVPRRPVGAAVAAGRTRYSSDPAEIKCARLESEAVFFERLGKQEKIESTQALLTDAKQRLQLLRRDVGPSGLTQLGDAGQELDRALETLDAALRNTRAASAKLVSYHGASTPMAMAIKAGRLDGAPLYAEIRRLIKTAERSLGQTAFQLSDSQISAVKRVDEARDAVAKSVRSLAADDPRRTKFDEVVTELTALADGLANATRQVRELAETLKSIRENQLPECFSAYAPDEQPPAPGAARNRSDEFHQPGAARAGTSVALLNQSHPAIESLDEAVKQMTDTQTELERLAQTVTGTTEHAEAVDAIVNKFSDEVRRLQAQADELLAETDNQLTDIKRLLTDAGCCAAKSCSHCGKVLVTTRTVQDPAHLCADAEEPIRQAEQSLSEAAELAGQMGLRLEQIEPPADATEEFRRGLALAIQRVRSGPGDRGAIELLKLAQERCAEFRKRQFEFYPGETYPPAAEPMPPRMFPPMVATYVARQTWHYPDYFEDVALERYGHSFGCVQPVVSYGKFLFDLALVPYNLWLNPPWEKQYELGLYRPGDCVPHLIYLPEWNKHAALFEAAVVYGFLCFP